MIAKRLGGGTVLGHLMLATAIVAGALMLCGVAVAADAPPRRLDGPAPAETRIPFVLRQQVDAEVSEFDVSAKKLRLKTQTGRLTLDGGNAAPIGLKKGDWVVVDVAAIRHPDPGRLPREDEAPRALLTQRVRASITGIQRSLGVVSLNTPAGRLSLEVPSAAVAGLRTGDPLLLELRVLPEPDPSALPGAKSERSKKGFGALLYMIFGRNN